jgi:hypothetical protein
VATVSCGRRVELAGGTLDLVMVDWSSRLLRREPDRDSDCSVAGGQEVGLVVFRAGERRPLGVVPVATPTVTGACGQQGGAFEGRAYALVVAGALRVIVVKETRDAYTLGQWSVAASGRTRRVAELEVDQWTSKSVAHLVERPEGPVLYVCSRDGPSLIGAFRFDAREIRELGTTGDAAAIRP